MSTASVRNLSIGIATLLVSLVSQVTLAHAGPTTSTTPPRPAFTLPATTTSTTPTPVATYPTTTTSESTVTSRPGFTTTMTTPTSTGPRPLGTLPAPARLVYPYPIPTTIVPGALTYRLTTTTSSQSGGQGGPGLPKNALKLQKGGRITLKVPRSFKGKVKLKTNSTTERPHVVGAARVQKVGVKQNLITVKLSADAVSQIKSDGGIQLTAAFTCKSGKKTSVVLTVVR